MLPKTLKYGSRIESAYARSLRSNIQPQGGTGTYNLGDTITINIPTRAGLVLVPSESYLKFNVNIVNNSTTANSFRWDSCGSHGIIQRVRVWSGSNMLQDIDNYGMLVKMLYDLQMPSDTTYGKLSLLSGTRSDLVAKLTGFSAATNTVTADNTAAAINASLLANVGSVNASLTTAAANGIPVMQINSGDRIEGYIAALAQNATATNTYCLSLVSLVGVLCSQNYIPLFEMTSAPLRVEIQLVDTLLKAVNYISNTGGTPSCTLTNVEYVGNFIELGDPAIAMIKDSLGGQPLQFVVPDYRNYVYNYALIQNSTASLAMPIACKFSSVKGIFCSIRDKGTGALTFFPYSSVQRRIADYQFRIGSDVFPSKVPSTLPEMFSEVLKATGSISDINQQPSIDKASYTYESSVAGTTADSDTSVSNQQSGSFYIGIDLESYANSDKSQIFTGYNTNTLDTYLLINFNNQGTLTASPNARFDAFANFDCVIICENGTAYCKF
jgi:hypothetical protein